MPPIKETRQKRLYRVSAAPVSPIRSTRGRRLFTLCLRHCLPRLLYFSSSSFASRVYIHSVTEVPDSAVAVLLAKRPACGSIVPRRERKHLLDDSLQQREHNGILSKAIPLLRKRIFRRIETLLRSSRIYARFRGERRRRRGRDPTRVSLSFTRYLFLKI